jgi:hypothetical protein
MEDVNTMINTSTDPTYKLDVAPGEPLLVRPYMMKDKRAASSSKSIKGSMNFSRKRRIFVFCLGGVSLFRP